MDEKQAPPLYESAAFAIQQDLKRFSMDCVIELKEKGGTFKDYYNDERELAVIIKAITDWQAQYGLSADTPRGHTLFSTKGLDAQGLKPLPPLQKNKPT